MNIGDCDEGLPVRLLLVRHGQDLDNARSIINGTRDTPLTELGRAQALTVADDLRSEKIMCIYTSPLQRARETASIIARRLGIDEIHVETELIERDYGILTGRPPSDIPALARDVFELNGFQYVIESDGIEHYASLWERAGRALRRIQKRHSGETVLIVAHNEIIKMMRANFEKQSWRNELLLPPITNCQVISLGSAARPSEP